MTAPAIRSAGMTALLALGVADLAFLNLWVFPRVGSGRPLRVIPAAVSVARSTSVAPPAPVAPQSAPAPIAQVEPVPPAPPPTPVRATGGPVVAIRRAYFAPGQHLPQGSSASSMAKIAALARQTGGWIYVDGHADTTGTAEVNDRLSAERAGAVVENLVSRGADRARIVVRHFGAEHPLVDGISARARRRNRRVDLTLVVAGDRP